MDQPSRWMDIFAKRFRRQLPLDVEHCSPIALRAIILDVQTPAHILDRIAQAYTDDEELLRDLVLCPNLDETTLVFIALTASEEIKNYIAQTRVVEVVMGEPSADSTTESSGEGKKLNIQQIIQRMSPSQKIKLALTGTKDARGLLIRESSKIVALSVLENPRITIGEIEFFAKSPHLNEDVIRKIGTNTEWTRKSAVISALVNNPKTPVGVSLPFVNRLSDRELAVLEKSRSIPEAVRTAARNFVMKRKLGKR
ncbi:MAG TPA: hypothetical protein VEI57_06315 [Nitrospirota bacterium]|nr:hypothetical protein [Nitrospirota bacterium]